MQNAVVHGLRYARKYAISAIAAGFCVVAAKAASVAVSSGTWSAAGVHAGDAVTVTGSCENDIDGVEPIAWLDNGRDRFCVAARRGKVTWLPVYMLSPFLFCEEKSLDFGALRLDSFAERVLLPEIEGGI